MPLARKHWPLFALPGALILAVCAKFYLDHPTLTSLPPNTSQLASSTTPSTPSVPAPDEYASHASYSQVEDKLYVGGRTSAPPPETLAVLSLSYNQDLYKVKFHRYASIPDGGRAPSVEWLQKQVAFIDQHQKDKEVTFVHCDAGVSRGPMVTAAYLMFEHHWTRDQALAFLKEKRPQIYPNSYFMDLLIDWEDALRKDHAPNP